MLSIILLATAGFSAGVLNAVAGGGSFLTFPALVFVGVPPISANATSTVAVFPGYLSAALGFIKEIKAFDRRELYLFAGLGITGGVFGAVLLLTTPSAIFSWIVPWLLLAATLLFAFDRQIRRWTASKTGVKTPTKILSTLAVTTYGGYFNGGLGIVLLSLFSSLGLKDMNLMNGLKNIMSFILSTASVITFAIAGIVYWKEAAIVLVMATIGGYIGAIVARKLPEKIFRFGVIFIGLVMSLIFFLR